MIVADASVLVDALTRRGALADRVRQLLDDEPWLVAPDIVKFEAASGIRGQVVGAVLHADDGEEAMRRLAALTVIRIPIEPLLPRMWELRHNLTSYDAAYVAAAEVSGARLVTCDSAMASVPGLRCEVELIMA